MTDINNLACSRLGTMLHLEIQKDKEAMKASKFQQDIGGTTVYKNILMMAIKGCVQLT